MNKTVDALKNLYVKLGGQLTDTYSGIADGIKVGLYKRIPDIIEAVKEKASGGAGLPEVSAADNGDVLTVVEGEWAKADAPSGLPEVSAADNGDVLTVVEGAWAKADAPSGGGLVVTGTTDETATTLNKTWQEINDALASGIGVVVVLEDVGVYTVTGAFFDSETSEYVIYATNEYTTAQASGYPSMSF